jgi:hypothetical protein
MTERVRLIWKILTREPNQMTARCPPNLLELQIATLY